MRGLVTARIAGLTPLASYDQSNAAAVPPAVGATWTASPIPLIPERDPSTLARLAFFVDDRLLEDPDVTPSDGWVLLHFPLRVRFLYEMRGELHALADWDGALRAGWHLARYLLNDDNWADYGLSFRRQPGPLVERRPLNDDRWLGVEVTLVAQVETDTRGA